jgi:protocatechuate 3,4-dioxygenase beta subunit
MMIPRKGRLSGWATLALLLARMAFAQTAQFPAASRAVLAPENEPGERMELRGVLLNNERKPLAGATVYAYHTDARGLYNQPGQRTPRLRGTLRSDEQGQFELRSIRPASYPNNGPAAHIHFEVTPRGGRVQYFEVMFRDDPKLTRQMVQDAERGGANRIIELTKGHDGVWRGSVEFRLP